MTEADPSVRFVIVNDPWLDRTFIWKSGLNTGKLTPNDSAFVPSASAGAGPRHFVFHERISTLFPGSTVTNFTSEILITPNRRFIYVAHRLHDTIASLAVRSDWTVRSAGDESTHGDYPRNMAPDSYGPGCSSATSAAITSRPSTSIPRTAC